MTSTVMGQFTVLYPQGRLDGPGGEHLATQIAAIAPQTPVICLNLGGVNFMDSAGLGKLVHGLKAARQNQCRLIFCHLPGQVKLILEIAKLERVFEIYENYEQVLQVLDLQKPLSLSAA